MFENIKVSVITPVYNDAKYILETVRSVLNQTHKNLELIIIDDCSYDESVDIVKSFNDRRIKIIRNDINKGPAFCRNVGIANSTGDYISFLDGDDLWLEDKIEKQLSFMVANGYEFCCTKYGTIDEEGINLKKYVYAPKVISFKTMVRCSYIGCLTVMYKRSVYPDLHIPNNIIKRNDYALWLKLSERTNCYFLNETTALYRKHGKGHVSSGRKTTLIRYHAEMFMKLYDFNKIKAERYAIRNAFYYLFKNIIFVRKS